MLAAQPSNPTLEPPAGGFQQRAVTTKALLKTFAATTTVLVASFVALLAATGGGQSFTTETLRRQQISQQAEPIPDLDVTLSSGQRTVLSAVLVPGGKVWLVDFVYTRCQTLCSSLGSIYQQLQAQIEARGLQDKIGLLSISFDPVYDDAPALRDYAKRMGLNPQIWQIATLTHWQDRRRLLDAFGIMVVPAPLGEFEHNAALHVVSADGFLVRILDYADFQTALDAAVDITQAAYQPAYLPAAPLTLVATPAPQNHRALP